MFQSDKTHLIRQIRVWLVLFIIGLVLSGVTAFPLQQEASFLNSIFRVSPTPPASGESALHTWLRRVHEGIVQAFAHLVIAIAFLGPLRDPVRNKWVLQFGVIACAGVVPLALIAGPIRGIPFYWRLIDCSFGVIGVIPLLICLRHVRCIERTT